MPRRRPPWRVRYSPLWGWLVMRLDASGADDRGYQFVGYTATWPAAIDFIDRQHQEVPA